MPEPQIPQVITTAAKICGVHRYSFRRFEWADLVGVRVLDEKPVFVLLYADGFLDYIPIEDTEAYRIETR